MISMYISNLEKEHWRVAQWVLRYLHGTRRMGLILGNKVEDEVILGYSDADFARDLDNGKSMIGYAFTVLGSLVSCNAALQNVVALSTTEAEYVALTEAAKEGLWLKFFFI